MSTPQLLHHHQWDCPLPTRGGPCDCAGVVVVPPRSVDDPDVYAAIHDAVYDDTYICPDCEAVFHEGMLLGTHLRDHEIAEAIAQDACPDCTDEQACPDCCRDRWDDMR